MANPTRAQLEKLIPNATITKELVDLRIECAVCLTEFYLNESGVRKLQCNHSFHAECLFPWLQLNTSCPVCRAKLPNVNQNTATLIESIGKSI